MAFDLESAGSMLAGLVCLAIFAVAYIGPGAWALGDAQSRGMGGGIIVVLFWLFGPLSAIVWLVVRPSTKVVDRQPKQYKNADDALADAAKLDQLGEWDAAIELYKRVAGQWPEHAEYVASCLKGIEEKQALN